MSSFGYLSTPGLQNTLSALEEVIKAQQTEDGKHDPTPTEFTALISTMLSANSNVDHLPDMLKVLIGVLPGTARNIARTLFKPLSNNLLNIAKVNVDDVQILSLSLTGIGELMLLQESSEGFWSSVSALQCVNALLTFLDSETSKIRKISHEKLLLLLTQHKQQNAKFVNQYVADFCLEVLNQCTRSNYKRSQYIVLFLELALFSVPEGKATKIIDISLKLQQCEIPKLTSAVYRMCDALFQNSKFDWSVDTTTKILKNMLQLKPKTTDMESISFYCTSLTSNFITLYKLQPENSVKFLPHLFNPFLQGCDSEFSQTHCAVGSSLKRIINTIMGSTTGLTTSKYQLEMISGLLSGLKDFLQLKYQNSWFYILDVIRSFFEIFKTSGLETDILKEMVEKLAEIYQAIEMKIFTVNSTIHISLTEAISSSLRCCGVAKFLSFVPLQEKNTGVKNENGIDVTREWVISILHKTLKKIPCKLSEFGGSILPIAGYCSRLVKNAKDVNSNEIQLARTRVLQLWSLFPEFCFSFPTDIEGSFPKLASVLEGAFHDEFYPEILPNVVVGLSHLARGIKDKYLPSTSTSTPEQVAERSKEFSVLHTYSTKFLPTLLKYLEGLELGNHQFQETVKCISHWTAIAPLKLVTSIAKKLLQLLLNSTSASAGMGMETEEASVWMAVMLAIIPMLSEPLVVLLFKSVRPLISSVDSSSVQKRAYNLLYTLLCSYEQKKIVFKSCEKPLVILQEISKALLTCHISSRNMRFRCIEALISGDDVTDDEMKGVSHLILGEVLLCLKDSNKKSRDGAFGVLKVILQRLPTMDILSQLLSAVMGETTMMRSSAITGICLLMLENRGDEGLMLSVNQLLPNVSLLLEEESSHQTKAILSLFRVCSAVLPLEYLRDSLPCIIHGFTVGVGGQKPKNLTRCRAIMRKLHHRLEEEELRGLIPQSDIALLEYVSRQTKKAQRKKGLKPSASPHDELQKMMGSDSEDSDLDIDESASRYGGSEKASHWGENPGDSEEEMEVDDYRLGPRTKAIRAVDALQSSSLPETLEDLLDDQPPVASVLSRNTGTLPRGILKSGNQGREKRKRPGNETLSEANFNIGSLTDAGKGTDKADGDDHYQVVITGDGKVTVKEKESDNMSLEAIDLNPTRADKISVVGSAVSKRSGKTVGGKKRKFNLKDPGEQYRSKKAGGDVWKKGMLEPHAFIPLDPRLLSKKNQKEAVDHFGAVIRNGKKKQIKASRKLKKGRR